MKKRIIGIMLCIAAVMMLTGCNGCVNDNATNTMPSATVPQASTEKHNNGTVTDGDGFIGNEDEENRGTTAGMTIIPDMSTAGNNEPNGSDAIEESTAQFRSIF